ncbi:MAG: hypothetical protein WA789_06940 [Candidatus Acidiferrum sp.]
MALRPNLRLLFCPLLIAAGFWISSCAAALGPGYSIEKQEIRVQFDPAPVPRIRIDSDYQLRNTGNQPLSALELRLPGHRRFLIADSRATWDGASLAGQSVPAIPRNTFLALPQTWKVGERHTLHLFAEFQTPATGEAGFTFASDAFFLPSQGWAPELLPPHGFAATGGLPPTQWRLQVSVPDGFLVHTSGRSAKTFRHGREITVQSVQHPEDRYPFVVAGLYKQTLLDTAAGKVLVWTRATEAAARLQQSADALVLAIGAYDATFGARSRNAQPLWVVECPMAHGCFTASASSYGTLLNAEPRAVSSELASADTLMIDFSGGLPRLAAAAPALAASWLGYGQNPAFYEQQPPLSALPAFASSLGQEAIEGPSSRTETIRRALRMIPRSAVARKAEEESVVRAKSFLFFFALQDRYGRDIFRRAIDHMLSARQGRGFNLDDLIAAFEEETHQNVAEFERLWMKRPGVPDEFRARYEDSSASGTTTSKETMP